MPLVLTAVMLNVRPDLKSRLSLKRRAEEKAEIGKIKDTVVPRLGSISALGNDHVQIASLRGGGRCCSADPHQQKWMKVQTKLLAKAVPGGRHLSHLAGQADHKTQPGGFQQNALQRLAGSQPRRAGGFRRP